jgi:hypothetical protein
MGPRPAGAKALHAQLDLETLAFDDIRQILFRQAQGLHRIPGEVEVAAFGDGTDSELRMPGDPDLPYDPYVERSVKRTSHFVPDFDSAAG